MTPWLRVMLVFLVLPSSMLAAAHFLPSRGKLSNSIAHLLRRLAWLIWTVLLVYVVSFILMRSVPGGPFDDDRGLAPELRQSLDRRFGLDLPVSSQLLRALDGLVHGDFGPSLTLRDFDVTEVIGQGLPYSILLGSLATIWIVLLGFPAGILAALRRGTVADTSISLLVALGLAIPSFVLAGVLMIPFCFALPILPAAGVHGISSFLLPSFCLGAPFAAQVARLLRTGLLEVLDQDWIRTARAKGLPAHQVLFSHAIRGGLVPTVVAFGPILANVLTGSLVLEQMFAIPGLGSHFVQSALNRDYTLSQGMIVLFSALVYVMNWASDVALAAVDPRVRLT